MKIGPYEIYPIEAGTFWLDGGAMFGVIPKVLWEKTNMPDARNRVHLATRCMLIQGNGKNILMDTGNGTKVTEKFRTIYSFDDTAHTLTNSLRSYGVMPEDITDVILSHLHFDHAGGSTKKENDKIVPAFQNATYYVQKTQWDTAKNPTERDRASFISDDYLALERHGVLRFLDGDLELFPGIEILISDGHTLGLQMLKISDGKSTLFYPADLIPFISHIPLPYIMGYDLRPLVTLEDKRKYITAAFEQQWLIFFEHDPSVTLGTVIKNEKGFTFGSVIEMK
jgi:glyoxylase-like metal-dependent hydrolase (beta-lactamase superfamily II)